MAKEKVLLKATYNKIGGNEKLDDEYLNEIENYIVNIMGPTTIYKHKELMEAEVTIYFQNINKSKSDINLPLEDYEQVKFIC